MKLQTKLLLAAAALAPAFSSAMAGPIPASVNPRTIPRISDDTRRALVPPPITEPCRAELSVDRIEVSRRADGSAYDISVTVRNSGSEAATGTDGTSRGHLGLKLDVTSIYRPRNEVIYSAQVYDIDVINAGASRSYGSQFLLLPRGFQATRGVSHSELTGGLTVRAALTMPKGTTTP